MFYLSYCCSVTESCLCDPMDCSTPASPVPTTSQNLLKLMSIELMMPSNRLILCCPFSCPQSFPASGSFPMSRLFASGSQSIGASASASASVLPVNIQTWFPLGLTGSSLCCPRDSQEASSAPLFKSIHSSALSLHYRPTLKSVPGYWKKHGSDYMGLCWQSDVSAFSYPV